MWLLPERTDHEGGGAAEDHATPVRPADRQCDERQHLSLRHVPPHSRRDQGGRGEDAMTDMDRRQFVHMLGVGGLVIAAGPLGTRRLDDAESLAASLADPFSPHAYVTLHEDGTVTII